ncbi:ATP-grasp domain-containing protein [Alteromonas sp. 345S023]|uniref:ATP-grasp domain-containing protein n=1 Tax=Alteromonas profundi TaxID=2696062 RepID=A0A7X5RKZ1_9ALTE|nr:RimK family protein [Alteromonas profundi]NDV90930.1 ATP-grasp domain-containing protein [Alteromonas profundi]
MHNTLIVADDVNLFDGSTLKVVTFNDYLADFPKANESKVRVINLCDTSRYLGEGYYCSLLAQARNHMVLPAVSTINDLRLAEARHVDRIPFAFSAPTKDTELPSVPILVLFGATKDQRFKRLARQAFEKYPCPILLLTLQRDTAIAKNDAHKNSLTGVAEVQSRAFSQLDAMQQGLCIDALHDYTQKQWKAFKATKRSRWDMAILVNSQEDTPPSNSRALRHFVKAAEKLGFRANVVEKLSPEELVQYDALFIRETTAIDHHTYRLARAAEQEGIVVMDDTQSILRCCNKVFLQDAFTYQKVPAPKSAFVSHINDEVCDTLISQFGLPMVLKLPESSFSRGVHKAQSREELKQKLISMLHESALVLVQEYIFTEFDWRIGILGGKPIYACKYFMARNHWQIYHHQGERFSSGGFTTLPTFEVPKVVLQAAIKAAKVVGNGLYGVDIKHTGNKVYVIEVNDNPSIDGGVEDKYLGSVLYEIIMQEFASRLEQRGR